MLSVKDKMTLDFERQWWRYQGAKDAAVRDTFGESATRFYARLNRIIDQSEALEYDPLLVRRLLRLRDQRREGRVTRSG